MLIKTDVFWTLVHVNLCQCKVQNNVIHFATFSNSFDKMEVVG